VSGVLKDGPKRFCMCLWIVLAKGYVINAYVIAVCVGFVVAVVRSVYI